MKNNPFKEEGKIENELYHKKKFSVVSNFRSSINKLALKPLEIIIPDEESNNNFDDLSNISSFKLSPNSNFKEKTKNKNKLTIKNFFENKDSSFDNVNNFDKKKKEENFKIYDKKKLDITLNIKEKILNIENNENKNFEEEKIEIKPKKEKKNKSIIIEKDESITSLKKETKSIKSKSTKSKTKKKNRNTRKKKTLQKNSSNKQKSCPFLKTENLDLLKDSKIIELNEIDSILLDRFLEPLYKVIFRDFKSFITKILIIIFPFICKKFEIRKMEWDLSGPFVLIFLLSLLMTINNDENEYFFVLVFLLIFSGSFFVTVNAKMLYCDCSFIQILNIFCFCMFPIFVADLCIFFFRLEDTFFIILFLLLAYLWSLFGMSRFLWAISPNNKGFLVIYPAFVIYMFVSYLNCWTYQKKYFY